MLSIILVLLATDPFISVRMQESGVEVHEVSFDQYAKIELVTNIEIEEGYEVEYYWEVEGLKTSTYEDGRILAAWGPPGQYIARFEVNKVNWELKVRETLRQKFIITIRGPPVPEVPVVDTSDLEGDVFSIVLRDVEDLTAIQNSELLELRTWVDSQEGVQHLEFDMDADSEEVRKYVSAIPDTAKLPFGFITRKKAQGGTAILHSGEFGTAAKTIELMKKYRG